MFSTPLMAHFRSEYSKAWNAERQVDITDDHWSLVISKFQEAVLAMLALRKPRRLKFKLMTRLLTRFDANVAEQNLNVSPTLSGR